MDSKSVVKLHDRELYSKEVMDQLVLSYLIHHGYTGTAKAVVQNAGHVSGQELFLSDVHSDVSKVSEKDMEERQGKLFFLQCRYVVINTIFISVIRSAIINGKIDEAIKLIDLYFPGVLQEEGRGKELQLGLKCGRFIEMMRECCNYNKSKRFETSSVTENNNGIRRSRKHSDDNLKQNMESGENKKCRSNCTSPNSSLDSPIPTSVVSRGRRLSYAAMAASISPSSSTELPKSYTTKTPDNISPDMMEIDIKNEKLSDNNSSPCGNVWGRRTSASSATNSLMSTDTKLTGVDETTESLKHVMEYGQKLQEEYRNDTRDKTRSRLVVI